MKNTRMAAGIAAALALLSLAACSTGEATAPAVSPTDVPAAAADTPEAAVVETPVPQEETDLLIVDEETGSTSIDENALATAVALSPSDALSADEAAALLFMREEEKLAHDVYLTLYEQWGIPIFQNIASSELTHTEAVKALIDDYGLEDPVGANGIGVFTDPALQALYDQLVAAGQESLSSALRVGAAIEEIDILDLEERIAQTDNADIILVYENLTKGSRNHLRSFVSTLNQQTAEVYVPQYLAQADYAAIIAAGIERNGRGG